MSIVRQPGTIFHPETTLHASDQNNQQNNEQTYYSNSNNYQIEDLFNEEIVSKIERLLEESTIGRKITISITILSIIAFTISGLLVVFDANAPIFDGSTDSIVGLLSYFAEHWFGLSQELTGNSYTTSVITSLVVGLLSESTLSWTLEKESKRTREIIEEVRDQTRGSKQIYPGSGILRFSYGAPGFSVAGGNVKVEISWDAIWFLLLLEKRDVRSGGRVIARLRSLQRIILPQDVSLDEKEAAPPNDVPLDPTAVQRTTHLLIFLKPTQEDDKPAETEDKETKRIDAAEYLVVPRRFFSNLRDSSPWQEFVSNLMRYKVRHEQRKRSAIYHSSKPLTKGADVSL